MTQSISTEGKIIVLFPPLSDLKWQKGENLLWSK